LRIREAKNAGECFDTDGNKYSVEQFPFMHNVEYLGLLVSNGNPRFIFQWAIRRIVRNNTNVVVTALFIFYQLP
jgi:hypothetical protein